MEEKEVVKEPEKKRKSEFDLFAIISILVMVISIGITLYYLLSFGK